MGTVQYVGRSSEGKDYRNSALGPRIPARKLALAQCVNGLMCNGHFRKPLLGSGLTHHSQDLKKKKKATGKSKFSRFRKKKKSGSPFQITPVLLHSLPPALQQKSGTSKSSLNAKPAGHSSHGQFSMKGGGGAGSFITMPAARRHSVARARPRSLQHRTAERVKGRPLLGKEVPALKWEGDTRRLTSEDLIPKVGTPRRNRECSCM